MTQRPSPERVEKCETGCMNYYGGERRHHKDCIFYPESMSAEIDALRVENEYLKESGRIKFMNAVEVRAQLAQSEKRRENLRLVLSLRSEGWAKDALAADDEKNEKH